VNSEDALAGRGGSSLEMHLEAVIGQTLGCTLRLRPRDYSDALAAYDRT
jgi:hypothetical protein